MLTEERAIADVTRLMLGSESIPVKVRMGKFIDEDEIRQLKDALHYLEIIYKNKSQVPKAIALAMVNVAAVFENRFYNEAQQERLEDIGADLEELAQALFS